MLQISEISNNPTPLVSLTGEVIYDWTLIISQHIRSNSFENVNCQNITCFNESIDQTSVALTLRLSLQRHHSCDNKLVEKLKLKTGFWFTKLISSPEPKIIKHDVNTNVYLACTERTQCENVLHHVYQQNYTPKLKMWWGSRILRALYWKNNYLDGISCLKH